MYSASAGGVSATPEEGFGTPATDFPYLRAAPYTTRQFRTFEVAIEGGPTKVPDIVLQPRTPDISETAPDPTAEKEFAPDDMSTPVQGN